jgi:hypothetical protein
VLIPWYVLGAQAVVIMTVTDIARLIWRDELPQNLGLLHQSFVCLCFCLSKFQCSIFGIFVCVCVCI